MPFNHNTMNNLRCKTVVNCNCVTWVNNQAVSILNVHQSKTRSLGHLRSSQCILGHLSASQCILVHLSAFENILIHLSSLEVSWDQSEACFNDLEALLRMDGQMVIIGHRSSESTFRSNNNSNQNLTYLLWKAII